LPRRQREAVVLRYFADLSEKDTAQVMGVSVGSVKAYTSRGLASLGQLLARSER
jgi:DNA-directed RNA polymerase specialized sigma24 family protein